jgi:hypothetical protein
MLMNNLYKKIMWIPKNLHNFFKNLCQCRFLKIYIGIDIHALYLSNVDKKFIQNPTSEFLEKT